MTAGAQRVSQPSFDMLYWIFAPRERNPAEFFAFADPVLDRDQAERQAAAVNGYVVGVSVMFLADRTDGVARP